MATKFISISRHANLTSQCVAMKILIHNLLLLVYCEIFQYQYLCVRCSKKVIILLTRPCMYLTKRFGGVKQSETRFFLNNQVATKIFMLSHRFQHSWLRQVFKLFFDVDFSDQILIILLILSKLSINEIFVKKKYEKLNCPTKDMWSQVIQKI